MNTNAASAAGKVTHEHLRRDAYLYVRQSTLKQVLSNTESTARQYGLRGRAVALGWAESQIIVIDTDQGQSGASAADREGFQRLVADVGMGHAGIVLGLEVSRLARNNTDWHRLLEICALAGTLILDEDGVYDPANFNDRLLLGLKGTMSEAELHFLKARLRGGVLSKARRGELVQALPVGLVYDPVSNVVLDPDVSVQGPVARVFTTFTATGSALAVVKAFAADGLLFPRRLKTGPRKGELAWGQLQHSRVLQVLHNPRYAGAFFYGRRTDSRRADGTMTTRVLPRDEWTVLITDAHPGYISWEQFEANQARLAANASAPRRPRPASRTGRLRQVRRPDDRALPRAQRQPSARVRLPVRRHPTRENDLSTHPRRRDRHRRGPVPPGHCHPAGSGDRAGRRRRAHRPSRRGRPHPRSRRPTRSIPRRPGPPPLPRGRPANRLVADQLEAAWNATLRELGEATDTHERARNTETGPLSAAQRDAVTALASDFPALWNNPATPMRERKRVIRLLVTDATLARTDNSITVHIRLKGGQDRTLSLPIPLASWQIRQTPTAVVSAIDVLLEDHTDSEIAAILTSKGMVSGTGQPLHARLIRQIGKAYHLRSHTQRLRDEGLLTLNDIAHHLGVGPSTVKTWRDAGLLTGRRANDKNEYLYQLPGPDLARPRRGRPPRKPAPAAETITTSTTRSAV